MLKTLLISVCLCLVTACASNKQADVFYHHSFDFSAVKSYSLYARNSPFSETQNLLDSRRNSIEIAIEKSMAQHHFSYAEPEQADVMLTYYLVNQQRGEQRKYNKQVHFCPPCLRASAWIKAIQYQQPVQGSLIVDIIDPNRNRSVWRSIYPLAIKDKDNSANSHEKIQQAITTMLVQYPTIAAMNKQLR